VGVSKQLGTTGAVWRGTGRLEGKRGKGVCHEGGVVCPVVDCPSHGPDGEVRKKVVPSHSRCRRERWLFTASGTALLRYAALKARVSMAVLAASASANSAADSSPKLLPLKLRDRRVRLALRAAAKAITPALPKLFPSRVRVVRAVLGWRAAASAATPASPRALPISTGEGEGPEGGVGPQGLRQGLGAGEANAAAGEVHDNDGADAEGLRRGKGGFVTHGRRAFEAPGGHPALDGDQPPQS